jgi:hypothetical protein
MPNGNGGATISGNFGIGCFTHWSERKRWRRFPFYEDSFWSIEAPKFDREFRVPTAEEALPFAFEVDPRWCYEKNNRKLPFGCHAWAKYDKEFWMEVLNKDADAA